MRWQGRRGSGNIEDRRSAGRMGGGGLRLGGVGLIAVLFLGYVFGVDVTPLLTGGGGGSYAPEPVTAEDDRQAQFASVVLADTEDVWRDVFQTELGRTYHPPVMVLFKGATTSGCGGADAASGPFYCPVDGKVYLDTAFFTTLADRLGAGGDFASAYVVAHEVGHHVQDELGILGAFNDQRRGLPAEDANALSVRVELQADCYAGLWAKRADARFRILDPGDVDEAMNAARQIGDDALAEGAGRPPMPDSFTHGTSLQRSTWFNRGYASGRVDACDTFRATDL